MSSSNDIDYITNDSSRFYQCDNNIFSNDINTSNDNILNELSNLDIEQKYFDNMLLNNETEPLLNDNSNQCLNSELKQELKELNKKIDSLAIDVKTIMKSIDKMNKHIDFIEESYQGLKYPLDKLKSMTSCIPKLM